MIGIIMIIHNNKHNIKYYNIKRDYFNIETGSQDSHKVYEYVPLVLESFRFFVPDLVLTSTRMF